MAIDHVEQVRSGTPGLRVVVRSAAFRGLVGSAATVVGREITRSLFGVGRRRSR